MSTNNNMVSVEVSIGSAWVRGEQVVALTVKGTTITFRPLEARIVAQQLALWGEILDKGREPTEQEEK